MSFVDFFYNMEPKPFSVVLLGPPGSGKSSGALCLSRFFQLEHIDMGRELRNIATQDTSLGKEVYHDIYEKNSLIPSRIIEDIMRNDICQRKECEKGIILDGAPRRLDQVESIERIFKEKGFPILCVVSLLVNEEVLIERVKKRYFCPRCFSFYIDGHDVADATKDPCPRCRYPLTRREDDTPEGLRRRFFVFREETTPVIEAYRTRGILMEIDGNREQEVVCQDIHNRIVSLLKEKDV